MSGHGKFVELRDRLRAAATMLDVLGGENDKEPFVADEFAASNLADVIDEAQTELDEVIGKVERACGIVAIAAQEAQR